MFRITPIALLAAFVLALAAPGTSRAYGEFAGFTQAELDQMLAPVALYPDPLLSHVLIAATYPIEVVQAARWTRTNPGLHGEQAVNAVIGQDWDPSVMALVAFPDLLARMDADLDWTQRLGDAFLIQEEQVLDSIQRLRGQAHRAGHLQSNEQVQVIREREVIYIEPARRQVVYVPVYDTRVVYGSWGWSHYPPVYWHYPPRRRSSVSFYWGPSYYVPPSFFFSSFHWSRRHVVVVNHHHHYYRPHHPRSRAVVHQHFYNGRDLARHDSAQRWRHDPVHRRGVAYSAGVDQRHRQIERNPARSAASSGSAPARVADSRSDQRQWAERRRADPMLSQRSATTAQRPNANRAATAAARQPAATRSVEQRAAASRATGSARSSQSASEARPAARTRGTAARPDRSAQDAARPAAGSTERSRGSARTSSARTQPDARAAISTPNRSTSAPVPRPQARSEGRVRPSGQPAQRAGRSASAPAAPSRAPATSPAQRAESSRRASARPTAPQSSSRPATRTQAPAPARQASQPSARTQRSGARSAGSQGSRERSARSPARSSRSVESGSGRSTRSPRRIE